MKYGSLILSLVFGFGGGALSVIANNYLNQKAMVIVHMDKIIADHIKKSSEINLSNDDILKRSELFARALEETVSDVSKENRLIIMSASSVATELPDYTNYIQFKVNQRLGE